MYVKTLFLKFMHADLSNTTFVPQTTSKKKKYIFEYNILRHWAWHNEWPNHFKVWNANPKSIDNKNCLIYIYIYILLWGVLIFGYAIYNLNKNK